MASRSAAAHCTHPAVAICPGLFLFLATTKGLSISAFPSESLHNFPLMIPLREKREARLERGQVSWEEVMGS